MYDKTNWVTGDIVTAEKLNKLEDGVQNAGGGVFAVGFQDDGETLDKTWKEIHDAVASRKLVFVILDDENWGSDIGIISYVGEAEDGYLVTAWNDYYKTDSETGYPAHFNYDNESA